MIVLSYLFRAIVIFIELFIAFIQCYLIVVILGCVISVGEKGTGHLAIFVQSNGIHTDLILPTVSLEKDWSTFVPKTDFPNVKSFDFFTVGWGDKGFFLDTPTWGDLTFSTAFNAIFVNSPTAMHVKYSSKPKESESIRKINVSSQQYLKIIASVEERFKLKNNKVELIPNKGYGLDDNFYEAKGSYHMFRTCNTFTNETLKKANLKTGIFALYPEGILRWY